MPGYETYMAKTDTRVAVLVSRRLTAIDRTLDGSEIDHVFIEILPADRKARSVFVLNIYSPPKKCGENFDYLIRSALKEAKNNTLLVLGDFNAMHPTWGYNLTSKKGNTIHSLIQKHALTLLTDPDFPTRVGNSVSRDTCPDLTMIKNHEKATWRNMEETLGSDHHILEVTISLKHTRERISQILLTDWAAFRKARVQQNREKENITSLQQWTSELKESIRQHSKQVQLTTENLVVDPHLVHMWDARRGLLKRWRKQKHNRKLKLRIAALTQQAEEYATVLVRQNWQQMCASLSGRLSSSKTWAILKHLLDPTKSKQQTSHTIRRILRNQPGSDEDILRELEAKYIGDHTRNQTSIPKYSGKPNEDLDRPFEITEVWTALHSLTRNTTPGQDGLTNKMLRNLDDNSIEALTTFFNTHWEAGTLPNEWKHAHIVLIPKPGKPPGLTNMRPISLTSCLRSFSKTLCSIA